MDRVFDRSKEEFNKYFENSILKDFPELKSVIEMIYSGSTLNSAITNAEAHLKHENILYKNTDYYYNFNDINDLEFIHFCRDPNTLQSIITSKSIWLNTVNNTNDTDEMIFASLPFGYSDAFNIKLRKEIFFLSFCTAKSSNANIDFDNSNNLPMWNRYGDDGKGIAFKFKITNNPDTWYAYHMSKIKYGSIQLARIEKLKKLIEDFNKTNPAIYIHLPKLFSFHKTGLWDFEDEVRLIYNGCVTSDNNVEPYMTYSNSITKELYPQITKIGKSVNGEDPFTLSLPLVVKDNNSSTLDSYLETAPNIELSEIILGYKHNETDLPSFRENIQKIMSEYLGYTLSDDKIQISKIKGKIR